MPKTVIGFQPPDIPNLASKLPEPLRQAGGFIGQLIADAVGADDPMSGIYPTPVAAPMISIFKDAAGVPQKALREEGTKRFLDSAQHLFERMYDSSDVPIQATNNFGNAVDWLAKKYPRVSAHMEINPWLDNTVSPISGAIPTARIHTPSGRASTPMMMSYSGHGFARGQDPADAYNTMAHEATHAAQALGNHNFGNLYHNANRAVGYTDNPFEQMARNAGENAYSGGRRADQFKQTILNPKVKDFINKVVKDRGLIDPGNSMSVPPMLEVGFNGNPSLTIDNILRNTKTTAEDRSLIESMVERMRKGGSGYVKGRDGHPVYQLEIKPEAPDGQRNATAMRMLEDLTRWGPPPPTPLAPPDRNQAYRNIERILKYRKGLPYDDK